MSVHRHSLGRESFITGLLGAGAVALWFLIVDTIAGRPFATPSVLGQVFLFGESNPATSPIDWAAVGAYTALHISVFLVLGAIVTKLVFLADRHGIVRFALVMLFFWFEVIFYGILTMFFQGTNGLFPFTSVLAANTLAAIVMGVYLYRAHPAIRRGLRREPLGSPPDPIATDAAEPIAHRR